MSVSVEYYFGMNSPFAFLGHDTFMNMASELEFSIVYRPVKLGDVFAQTGGLPLPKRHPARQYYRLIELQRWREKRGLNFHIKPKFFPFDASLADRTVIAITEAGQDPAPFMALAFRSTWQQEEDLADEAVIIEDLEKAGMKGKALVESAMSDAIGDIYDNNTAVAIEKNCVGSPCYVLNGEPFWGQDRLELLGEAIKSGRDPFTDDAA